MGWYRRRLGSQRMVTVNLLVGTGKIGLSISSGERKILDTDIPSEDVLVLVTPYPNIYQYTTNVEYSGI